VSGRGDPPPARESVMNKIESAFFSVALAVTGAFTLIVVPFG
jgi:hypothetical protein